MNKIHTIFKTHLDVGFTDFARNVVASYFEHYIPKALDVAERLRLGGEQDRFVWTTGSWLIYEYLEQAVPAQRERMEKAILAGDIVWHGLPFTTHSELMDVDLFRFGLSLSKELDARFGRKTIAAKMTDVPGHTLGIVPLLADAGIQFLHIGVNPASTPPEVPPVFTWRSPQGAEVVVMYHKGSYGDLMQVPGMVEAICFAHTGDNLGPQSPEQIQGIFQEMRERFPGVTVCGSTMDAFAAQLMRVKDSLPVVTDELGDTWIHGAGSDPKKISQFRELLRLRAGWLKDGRADPNDPSFKAFSRFMLLVPEHTWGMDEKTHLADYQAYDAASFRAARAQANFRKFESSWDEQRGYLRSAVAALPSPLAEEAQHALQAAQPQYPDLSQFEPVDTSGVFETAFFRLRFDAANGAIIHLEDRRSGRVWADENHPLGLFRYELFSQADYDRFYRQYAINKRTVASWAIPDLTKPGMASAGAAHQEWLPRLSKLYRRQDAQNNHFLLVLEMPELAASAYGCPKNITMSVLIPTGQPAIHVDLQWFNKPACRLPEALWFSFAPPNTQPRGWRLLKMGQAVSPLDVVRSGNRHLHAVQPGVRHLNQRQCFEIDTLDAALVAPGERSLLNFNNRQPVLAKGMHFLLYNNIWGTNFPMWYEEDACFRFILHFAEANGEEK